MPGPTPRHAASPRCLQPPAASTTAIPARSGRPLPAHHTHPLQVPLPWGSPPRTGVSEALFWGEAPGLGSMTGRGLSVRCAGLSLLPENPTAGLPLNGHVSL